MAEPHKITKAPRGRPSRADVYDRLRVQIGELRERLGNLPSPLEAADIWRGIWFEEAHHSTAIEGNTLVLKQVEVLLAEGRAVGAKELREYMEVRGYAEPPTGCIARPSSRERGPVATCCRSRSFARSIALAMTPVWDVAPHPHATERRGLAAFGNTTSSHFQAA